MFGKTYDRSYISPLTFASSLVRYLRARSLDVHKAEKMLMNSIQWRKNYPVPSVCTYCATSTTAHCVVRLYFRNSTDAEIVNRE